MDKKWINLITVFVFSAFILTTTIFVPAESKMALESGTLTSKELKNDVNESILEINSKVNAEIFDLPEVYTLPMELTPGPKPNPKNFTETSYEDETISVKCWTETMVIAKENVVANFAEVKIAHPTQLRTALAGGKYGTFKRYYATKIAAENNAVIAINADFYNCRTDGVIIRQGTLYRNKPCGIDTLFIDSDGNLSVVNDNMASKDGYYEKNKIYQSIVFGPLLVKDGKAVTKKAGEYRSVDCDPRGRNPRTAIGQLGKLHYLLCVVDGRSEKSIGVQTNQMAQIMADKNCSIAYNLDGGQSSVMIFNNKVFNVVSGGGERVMSDILYFSTAIPESNRN